MLSICLVTFFSCSNDSEEIQDSKSYVTDFDPIQSSDPEFFDDSEILRINDHLTNFIENSHNRTSKNLNTVKWVIDYQNVIENFVENLIIEHGYPVWSRAYGFQSDYYAFYAVPFIKENSESTESILLVKFEEDIMDFKIVERNVLYNVSLAEASYTNTESVLDYFIDFDASLFGYSDPIFTKYKQDLSGFSEDQSNVRGEFICICTGYIIVLDDEDKAVPRGSCAELTCNSCLCWYSSSGGGAGGGVGSGGWGSTGGIGNGGSGEGTAGGNGEGGSGFGGSLGQNGSSGFGDIDGGANPMNWWDEYAEDELLLNLIIELELDEEIAECLAMNNTLKAEVKGMLDNIYANSNPSINNIIQAALESACDCSCNEKGESQTEEFKTNLFENLFSLDADGILHVAVDPIDMNTSTDQEILDQFITVINLTRLFFCEMGQYEPIDWRDYFDNIHGMVFNVDSDYFGNVSIDYDIAMSPNYIMETSPGFDGNVPPDRYIYTYYLHNTNFATLSITVDLTHLEQLEEKIKYQCE